jgi:hypothetical protein
MSDPRPTAPLADGSDGDGVNVSSSNPLRPGFPHPIARWALDHPKWITALAVLGFLAFCGWQAWAAFQPSFTWGEDDTNKLVLEDRMDRASIMLAGMLAWMFLATVVVRGKLDSMKWSGWDSLSFNARLRERILRGVPIPNGVLLAFALFSLIGLVLGLALIGGTLSLLPWVGSPAAKIGGYHASAPVMALFALISSAHLLWQILIQAEWDYFVGDRRLEVAAAFLQAEEAEREEEREEKRTSIGLRSWAVLIGGFVGGVLLSSLLPETEQSLCISSGLSGLVAAGSVIYIAGTRPRGSATWLTLVAVLLIGALIYFWLAFDHPTVRALLLGVSGGVTVGAMFTLMHLKQIRRYAGSNGANR